MSDFIERVRDLLRAGDVRISEHGYDELAEDGLTAREVLAGVKEAVTLIASHGWLRPTRRIFLAPPVGFIAFSSMTGSSLLPKVRPFTMSRAFLILNVYTIESRKKLSP